MTKLEICAIEGANRGQVNLYPEGAFYKAYQQSAWLLCTHVHPFKVSARPLKGLDGPLLSVGFPMSSFEKFARGLGVTENPAGGKVLSFGEDIDFSDYIPWRDSFSAAEAKPRQAPYNSMPVYGDAYRLASASTEFAARLDRNYRYSLGEDIRKGAKQVLLCIVLAGKGEQRLENIRSAYRVLLDVQLSFRLLNDLHMLTDNRYVDFLELTESISRQLTLWERSERSRSAAGVPSPP